MVLRRGNQCIQIGGMGAVIAAVCCFTPLLVVILGSMGLGMMMQYLDLILLPALVICLGLLTYGFRLRKTVMNSGTKEGFPKGLPK